MVFKVGDKVKYDNGDWLFYGTVSAIIENSISPCYRLTVERMEKMNCKFSITQFEFELALEKEVDKSLNPILEVATQEVEKRPKKGRAGAWERNLESFQKGERSNSINTWISRNRQLFKSKELPKEKLDKLTSINFPFEAKGRKGKAVKKAKMERPRKQVEVKPKRTNSTAWEQNYELFKNGEKSNTVYAWISGNRKKYKANKLSEYQLNKLTEANFQFEVPPRENQLDSWHRQFRLWKNGNRTPSLQSWRETSVKRFVQGRLSQERISKLKEVGILK